MTEAAIAARVKTYFEATFCDVYQEVVFRGCRIDLVATNERDLITVEVKRKLCLDVIAQASRWVGCAESWVATPPYERDIERRAVVYAACRYLGIGVLEVTPGGGARAKVLPTKKRGKVRAECAAELRAALHPEQLTQGVAGSKDGGYSTAFRRTAAALEHYVAGQEGCTLEEAVRAIAHHYRNDKSAVEFLSRALPYDAVRIAGRGAKARLYIKFPRSAP